MVCAGLGQDENTQAGTGKLVGVPGHVVVPPGDHHDGGLQGQLQGRLGQDTQGVQNSGPGKVFKSEAKLIIQLIENVSYKLPEKVILPFTNLDQVPYDQGHWV